MSLQASGLKDPDNAIKQIARPVSLPVDEQAVVDLVLG